MSTGWFAGMPQNNWLALRIVEPSITWTLYSKMKMKWFVTRRKVPWQVWDGHPVHPIQNNLG
jgi:hypothetical protein